MMRSSIRSILILCLASQFYPKCSLDLDLKIGGKAKSKTRFEKALLLSLQTSPDSVLQPSPSELQALAEFEEELTSIGWNQPDSIRKSSDALSETFSFSELGEGELEADLDAWEQGTLVWPKPTSPQKLKEIRKNRLTTMRSYYNAQIENIKNLSLEDPQSLKMNVSAGIYLYSYFQEVDQTGSAMDPEFQKENLQWLVRIREAVIREQIRKGETL